MQGALLASYLKVSFAIHREEDQQRQKEELSSYEDRLENLRQQLSKERNKSLKKTNKEVAEVRSACCLALYI